MSESFSPQPGRPEAAAVIWRWREAGPSEGPEVSPGKLRATGLIQGIVGAAIGSAVYLYGFHKIGTLAVVLAVLIALLALLSPTGLYASLQRLFLWTGRVVGRGVTWIVMVPLFYGLFYPLGLVLRRGRRDRMKRFYDREAATYWEPRPERDVKHREHPY